MQKTKRARFRLAGRSVVVFVASLLSLALLAPAVMAAENYEIAVIRNVEAKMRDGVTLRADVYRPRSEGRYPVLLVRTPYDKQWISEFGHRGAARGYVVIAQDVRGRFESEGEWYAFRYESQDGYDTVEWAAALPYSNGKVGMFGGSYVGATQLLAAIARPPHLAGICPTVTASNYHDGWTYQGGAFEQWFNESWTTGLAENTMRRRAEQKADPLGGTKVLPLISYPVLEPPSAEGLAPYFKDWLAHPNFDEYWKQLSIEDHYAQIQVPVFSMGAWYDIFLGGTLKNYVRLKTEGGTEAARRGQRLAVSVGGHAGESSSGQVGAVEFGNKLPADGDEAMLRWYDWLLKGETNGVEREKPVKIFVMGKNEWREEDDWPLARAKNTRYYLHSAGAANGIAPSGPGQAGRGSLSTVAPAEEKPDQYVYDPSDAAPTIGGPLCCGALPTGIGPEDQRPAEARGDVLVYTTPAFAKDTEVTGPVSLDLYVGSSAVDTDFTGMLVDVWPNGFAQNLTSGILRLRYRNSQEKPELANPGETYHITVDLWATSNVFLAGHKLRLEVSSSNFPRFDRNLNTGEEQARGTRMVKAANVIYHDKLRPSALVVAILP
jgi:putative CocE/NonD family hydrolase